MTSAERLTRITGQGYCRFGAPNASRSFPHSICACPQIRPLSASTPSDRSTTSRRSRRYFLACSSSVASPEEASRKQYRRSPLELVAMRNRNEAGVSSPEAVKCISGSCAALRPSSPPVKRTVVGDFGFVELVGVRGVSTGPGGCALGIPWSELNDGGSISAGRYAR